MAENNLRIWDALSKTDPKHTKPFSRAGGFKGTATKPIWLIKRLTEHFGPAGTGWGMDKPEFQTVIAGEEILVFCTVALWYKATEATSLADSTRAVVYGVGGDKVLAKRQTGPFTNDEAFKASYTDALSNAMKQIGVAADIHMGLFDDSKYREEVGREFANGNDTAEGHKPGASGSASGGTDFRPAGARRFDPDGPQFGYGEGGKQGAIEEARRDGILSNPNDTRSRYEQGKDKRATAAQAGFGRAPTDKEAKAAKIRAGVEVRIKALKEGPWIPDTLKQYWDADAKWREWMADPANDSLQEWDRYTTAYAEARDTLREYAQ